MKNIKKVVRLTESDLVKIVKRVIKENSLDSILQLSSGGMVMGANSILSGERPKKFTIKDQAIFQLKVILMQLKIWSNENDPRHITDEEKEDVKNYIDSMIESAFNILERENYPSEDFLEVEELSNRVKNYAYSLYNIEDNNL